jgi:hypothetical protein
VVTFSFVFSALCARKSHDDYTQLGLYRHGVAARFDGPPPLCHHGQWIARGHGRLRSRLQR